MDNDSSDTNNKIHGSFSGGLCLDGEWRKYEKGYQMLI